MTKQETKTTWWKEYNRLGAQVTANRLRMRGADAAEKRRLIRENHELMVKMNELIR